MSGYNTLDAYLNKLDQCLSQMPVADRAEIITEIKSHVMDAKDRNPEQGETSILASLGEPESVANRYLMERGLPMGKASKSPMVKWLTIGFLGTFAMILLFAGTILWKFTPLIEVDEKSEKVQILGGLIKIDGAKINIDDKNIKFSQIINNGSSRKFNGSKEVNLDKIKTLKIPFNNGKMKFKTMSGNSMNYECEIEGRAEDPNLNSIGDTLTFSFENTRGSKCEFSIPDSLAVNIEGGNGKIEFNNPLAALSVKLGNGKIDVDVPSGAEYAYDLDIVNGKIDSPESSKSSSATPVNLRITNGKIKIREI